MSFGIGIKVRFTRGTAIEDVREAVSRILFISGLELRKDLFKAARQRPDGLGGQDGAVNTGIGSDSIDILSRTPNRVTVGTPLRYMHRLARGLPDPNASLDQIQKWAQRKGVAKDPVQIWDKIKTDGPIENPWDRRGTAAFVERFPQIIEREAQL